MLKHKTRETQPPRRSATTTVHDPEAEARRAKPAPAGKGAGNPGAKSRTGSGRAAGGED